MRLTNKKLEKAHSKASGGFNPIDHLPSNDVPNDYSWDGGQFDRDIGILDDADYLERICSLDGGHKVYHTDDGAIWIIGDAHGAWAKDVTEYL